MHDQVRIRPNCHPCIGGIEDLGDSHGARLRENIAAARFVDELAQRTLLEFAAQITEAHQSEGCDAIDLVLLSALERLRILLEKRIDAAATTCRTNGSTWAEIGDQLRITRQSAHERFRRRGRTSNAAADPSSID